MKVVEKRKNIFMNSVCSEVLEYTFAGETGLGLLLG